MAQILILDDEQPLLQSLSMELKRHDHECLLAETGREAFRLLERFSPDLAILDVKLPDISGLDVLRKLRADMPEVPVLMVTAYASVDSAVEAMKEGAIDYLEKPLDLEELQLVVERELQNSRMRSDVEAYRRDRQSSGEKIQIVGNSPALDRVRTVVDQISNLDVARASELPTVLILGETGSGKDLLARHVHYSGPFGKRPFVRVNCAGLPRDLVESELFGHEKGAFTGAGQRKQGLFEVAQEGAIFLDEIGDMPLDIQGKLLNVLETRRVRRVGGTREHQVDTRIIAATNRDLEKAVADETFRSDLYYRLKVVSITLPAVRDRREDIAPLAQHFLDQCRKKYRKPELHLTDEVVAKLEQWSWPGNVRELAHTIEHLALTSPGPELAAPVFPGAPPVPLEATATATDSANSNRLQFDFNNSDCTVETVEKALIRDALEHANGNVSEVARLLGMSRGALRHRMEKWGID